MATVTNGKTETVELKDVYEKKASEEKGKLIITKTVDGDNITESEFNGALKFEITTKVKGDDGQEVTKWLDKDGKLSDSKVELTLKDGGFVKGDDGKYTKTFENIAARTYTVKETNSNVEGYELVTGQSISGGKGSMTPGGTVTIDLKGVYKKKSSDEKDPDKKYEIRFRNIMEGGKLLPGASVRIVNTATGAAEERWASHDEKDGVSTIYLAPGTYIMQEEENPNTKYFEDSEDIEFTVDEDGNVTLSNGEKTDLITMMNPLTEEGKRKYDPSYSGNDPTGTPSDGPTKKPSDDSTDPSNPSGTPGSGDKPGKEDTRPTNPSSSPKPSSTKKPSGTPEPSATAKPAARASSTNRSTRSTSASSSSGTSTGSTTRTGGAKTGDASNAAFPLAGAMLGLLAILGIAFDEKRRRRG